MIKYAAVAAILFAGFFAGCDTEIQVTFENTTDEPLELHVNGSGSGVGYLGTIPPGGQIISLIEVDDAFLPAVYTYTAGNHPGSFAVTKDMHSRIWETIPEGAPSNEPAYRHAQGAKQVGEIPVIVNP